jgi:ABC-type sugar transport system permease subunit
MATQNVSSTPARPANRTLSILLGILFLLPAVLACGASQGLLSVGTFLASQQNSNLITPGRFVGLQNYILIFQAPTFWGAFGFTALTVLVRLLAVAFVPALLAWGLGRPGRGARLALRLLFTVPVAAFMPVVLALMWSLFLSPAAGFVRQSWLGQPASARLVLLFVDGLVTLGLACAAGLVFALAAARNPDPGKSQRKPLLAVWGIGLLAAAASGLQSFTWSFVLTNGGPARSTMSLLLYLFDTSFQYMKFGLGAAAATVVLLLLAVLGLAAGSIVVFAGLKIGLPGEDESAAAPQAGKSSGGAGRGALVAALLVCLLAFIASLLPFIGTLVTATKGGDLLGLQQKLAVGRTLTNSLLPALIAVLLVQAPLSYLGALGIGALRPLGRHSEWLLLPFCLWLFTGPAPFSLYAYQLARQLDWAGRFVTLVPPLAISVPMLVILSLFFKGQQGRFEQARAVGVSGVRSFFTRLVLPSVPLTALLVVAGIFASLQESFWPQVFATQVKLYPASMVLLALQRTASRAWPTLAVAMLEVAIPTFLFFFLVFGIFQLFYVERLSFSGGRD